MTLYGYARVSVREPEDKNLDLQVERLVRAGCSMGNIRAEEASGAKDDRGGLLELLDLVVEGDTLVVTHIDRLSRGLTYNLRGFASMGRAIAAPENGGVGTSERASAGKPGAVPYWSFWRVRAAFVWAAVWACWLVNPPATNLTCSASFALPTFPRASASASPTVSLSFSGSLT